MVRGFVPLAPGIPALDAFPYRPLDRLAEVWRGRPEALLGFASTPEERIGDAVRTLAALVENATGAPARRTRP